VIRHNDDLQAVGELELAHPADGRTGFQGLDGLREHHEGECEKEEGATVA
jgi:hypothetical protein